jgi:hypothetical protein
VSSVESSASIYIPAPLIPQPAGEPLRNRRLHAPTVAAVEPLLAQATVLLATVQRLYMGQGREHCVVSATLIHAHRALCKAGHALRVSQDGEWAATKLCDVVLTVQRARDLSSH